MIRSAGVLLPVFSLPSPYGIGTLGSQAKEMIDFLAKAGQTYWQILPTGPTGFGNSPYQSLSSYAGNPYLIDLDTLIAEGLLQVKEVKEIKWSKKEDCIDYGILYNEREKVLKIAADRLPILHPEEYFAFLKEEKDWIKEYAIFMSIKKELKGIPWQKWPEELRDSHSEAVKKKAEELHEDVCFYERIQYFFYTQMKALKKYAEEKHIQIIGDLPFYAAADSIDVWSHPEEFDVNTNDFTMTYVSGFPADAGNPEGQKWGNPLFNWDYQKNERYQWWIKRAVHTYRFCDVLRIDHFQGYISYFAVPAEGSAKEGQWRKGPGLDLFHQFEADTGIKNLIIEDLGVSTDEIKNAVKESNYPGMRIFQYGFDANDIGSVNMPWQYIHNSVAYTGTHDNETIEGWKKDPNQKNKITFVKEYLNIKDNDFTDSILAGLYGSASDLAIVQMQDLLKLDNSARMNDPAGSVDPWTWRCSKEAFDEKLAKDLEHKMFLYCRSNWANR